MHDDDELGLALKKEGMCGGIVRCGRPLHATALTGTWTHVTLPIFLAPDGTWEALEIMRHEAPSDGVAE